jgi:hypothetical protein
MMKKSLIILICLIGSLESIGQNKNVVSAINYDFAKTQRYDLSVVNNNFSNSSYEQLGSSKYYYNYFLQ